MDEDHLPECELITFREYRAVCEAEGLDVSGLPHNPDDPWYDQAGFVKCAEDCPSRARDNAWVEQLAEKHGWGSPQEDGE